MPYQIGPHIFDQDGVYKPSLSTLGFSSLKRELVWTGSRDFNRNIHDFRMVGSMGDDPHLAMLLPREFGKPDDKGTVGIYDNQYNSSRVILDPVVDVDMPEINVMDPHRALALMYPTREQKHGSVRLTRCKYGNVDGWVSGIRHHHRKGTIPMDVGRCHLPGRKFYI